MEVIGWQIPDYFNKEEFSNNYSNEKQDIREDGVLPSCWLRGKILNDHFSLG